MGLLASVAEFLVAEHKYRPIKGDVLFVGRQTTFLNETTLSAMLGRHGLRAAPNPEFDTETVAALQGGHYVTDRYFMRCLGVEKLRFLDVSNYEGADIVHDLGVPVDASLHERFDFIYNGGCFDNMFNPGQAMMNLSRMLKPGGRIVCLESAASYNSPYLMYSPGWFFDYYATNRFADCKIYVCSYRTDDELFFGPWNVFFFDWPKNKNGPSPEATFGNHILLLTIAEKGRDSTADRQPIQFQYRHDATLNAQIEATVASFDKSPRPIVGAETSFPESSTLRMITDRLRLTLYRTQRHLRPRGKLSGASDAR